MKTDKASLGKGQDAGFARESALVVLEKTLLHGQDLQAALDAVLRQRALSLADAALCTELCYGALRSFLRLNWLLGLFLRKPEQLPPLLRLRLLLGAYELTALSGVPDYASLYQSVQGIRAAHGEKLGKLGNAVLRELQRLGQDSNNINFFAEKISDKEQLLSVYYSVPLWIVQLWRQSYGEKACDLFLKAAGEKPPLGLRVNLTAVGGHELLQRLRQLPGAMTVAIAGVAFQDIPPDLAKELPDLLRQGRVSRQSAASQEALASLAPQEWPTPIWDACAGRGGKSAALLEYGAEYGGASLGLCSDVSLARLRGLRAELKRLGLQAPVAVMSAMQPAVRTGVFQSILLDAPCSGLGTLSRHPDISQHRQPEHLAGLLKTQAQALRSCAALLPKGGVLAYLTCTLNPAENEQQIADFLATEPAFTSELLWQTPADSPWKEFFWGVRLRRIS